MWRLHYYLFIIFTSATVECRIRSPLNPVIDYNEFDNSRIVGGNVVKPHSIPYQAGLSLLRGTQGYWCGGTVISNQYIITAAHCLISTSQAVIVLGAHNVSNTNESGQLRIPVSSNNYIIHPAWNQTHYRNDIALIRLPEPITLNDKIQPMNLPRRSHEKNDFVGKMCLASGWGKSSDHDDTKSSVLRSVRVPVMGNNVCREYYFNSIIQNMHLCINADGGKSTCAGDSGGPLVYEEKNGDKLLVGVTSFSMGLFGCEWGFPTVFARVTLFLDWIQNETGIKILP